jgi:hypothetical protein
VPAFGDWPPDKQPVLGFIVAGHAAGETLADEYQVLIANGDCGPPQALREHESASVTWNGEPEAITRLLLGFGTQLPQVLVENLGVPAEQAPEIIQVFRATLERQFVHPAMPIQDAIDLRSSSLISRSRYLALRLGRRLSGVKSRSLSSRPMKASSGFDASTTSTAPSIQGRTNREQSPGNLDG